MKPSRQKGPSPRVRGKRDVVLLGSPNQRSIPARAGETCQNPVSRKSERVHPRACGGNETRCRWWSVRRGPSPRVRGKRLLTCSDGTEYRSIPARAGETGQASESRVVEWVHPRACGGNIRCAVRLAFVSGPSPRVRGKRPFTVRRSAGRGSIPARAGETVVRVLANWHDRVHPRACGGNRGAGNASSSPSGPSPRVRGKPVAAIIWSRCVRSIPARAGETSQCSHPSLYRTVHPRACGGNPVAGFVPGKGYGPSPRVRGKQRL